jgi:beta-glucosidase
METAATGIRWNFAPVLAVSGDIRWGRTYETYGSDPAIVTSLGAAYIEGLQRQDLSDPESVIATAKHFIGDGSTEWGTSTTADYIIDQGVTPPDDTLLQEVLVPPYRAAVDAGVGSVMTSFSSWGSTKMHASDLMTNLLKSELGFDGFVVSDWGGVDQIDLSYSTSIVAAVNAGIDMNMVPYDPVRFMWSLGQAVEQGEISLERIDDAVTRILTAKFEMGLFEQPMADRSLIPSIGSDEHRALAREAVAKSAVLLKNEDVFPIRPDVASILIVGEAADDPGIQAGGWTISWQGSPGDLTGATSILEAIEERAPENTEVIYSRTGRLRGDLENIEADVCIAAMGETPYAEGLGDDGDLELGGLGVLETLGDKCGQTAMILVTGRPVIVTDFVDQWDALITAWWFGSEAGGLADLIFGDMPFTARLPVAWPRAVADLPTPADPLYPLGFGLDG